MNKKTIFILLLIVLASSPFGILGHELWHLGFSYFYGGKPISICVNFDDSKLASSLINITEMPKNITYRCYINFIDELIAYIIATGIIFLMIYVFVKKYINLLEETNG